MVNHPPHYRALPGVTFECIDIARELTFTVGNAVKYLWRAEAKNGRQDVEKAQWYLRDAIRHADPIFATPIVWQTQARLHVVARAQTNYHRKDFFNAIRFGDLPAALRAVNRLLSTD